MYLECDDNRKYCSGDIQQGLTYPSPESELMKTIAVSAAAAADAAAAISSVVL